MNVPDKSPQRPTLRTRRRRRALRWGLATLAFVLVLSALPLLVEAIAERQLRLHLADYAEIGDVDLNLFTGRVAVSGLSTRFEKQALIESGEFTVEIALLDLFDSAVRTRQVKLRDAVINVTYHDDGSWWVGRRTFPTASGQAEPVELKSAWFFALDELVMQNVTLHLNGADWRDTLFVESARIAGVDTRIPDSDASLQMRGTVDGADFAVELSANPLASEPRVSGKVTFDGLDLASLDLLSRLLPDDVAAPSGTLDAAVDLDLRTAGGLHLDLSGDVAIGRFEGGALARRVALGMAEWKGRLALRSDEKGLHLAPEGELVLGELRYEDAVTTASLGSARWQGQLAMDTLAGGGLGGRHEGELAIEALGIDGASLGRLELASAALQSESRFDGDDTGTRSEGALRFEAREVRFDAVERSVQIPEIDLDATVYVLSVGEGAYAIDLDGALGLLDATFSADDLSLAQRGGLDWQGRLQLGREAADGFEVVVDGQLKVPDTRFVPGGEGPDYKFAGLEWAGKAVHRGGTPQAASTQAEGRLTLQDLGVTESGRAEWFAAERISVDGVDVNWPDSGARLGKVEVRGIRALAGTQDGALPMLELDGLTFDALRYADDQRVELGEANLDGLRVRIARDEAGLVLPARGRNAAVSESGQGGADTQADQGGTTVTWTLARLEVVGESRLAYIDRSLAPPFEFDAAIEQLTATDLDSADQAPQGNLELSLRAGEYTVLDIEGALRPSAAKPAIDLQGSLSGFNMPMLNGYLREHLGYQATSGQLDAKLSFRLEEEQLAGEQQLSLERFEIEPLDSEVRVEFEKRIGMSLGSALKLLRDRQDNIKLTLPISGSLDDPKFDLSDAIGTAVAKATRTAMLGVLTFALQPYGAIIMAADFALGFEANVKLEPMVFPPGIAERNAEAGKYVDRLVALLGERPGVRMNACGRAVEADRIALAAAARDKAKAEDKASVGSAPDTNGLAGDGEAAQPRQNQAGQPPAALPVIDDAALMALAEARAAGIKRVLVERGIDPGRLFVCEPKLDTEEGAVPRVDLFL